MKSKPIISIRALGLLACVVMFALPGRAGLSVVDESNGFTLELPEGFVAHPGIAPGTADILHAFVLGDPDDDQVDIILLIKALPGTIGREPILMSDMPSGFTGSLFKVQWQGFEVDGFEVPEQLGEVKTVTYNVQIPLKRAAIQVMLYGEAEREAQLKSLLPQILAGLSGESNWVASGTSTTSPATAAGSEAMYRNVLIAVAAVIVIGGLILLWWVSGHSPKGTVLALAVGVYVIGVFLASTRIRELLLVGGSLQLLGFSGGLLGLIDLIRKRKPKQTNTQDG